MTERVSKLMLQAAARQGMEGGGPGIGKDWDPPSVIPESCFPSAVFLQFGRQKEKRARELLGKQRAVHPEILTSYWLSPNFWLDPIRTWIG